MATKTATECAHTFCEILNEGIETSHVTDAEIAHSFGVSRPTVKRWRSGDAAPHPKMQATVLFWLCARTLAVLK